MVDPLYNKIIDELEALSDGDKFEACANSLLLAKYPFLTWIKGGNDAGFDGAGVRADGTRVQLVCTTQDNVIGNVTNSLKRARDENQKSEAVLVATSRRLSPEQKRNLNARVAEFGKSSLPIEDQSAFAELIYHSPRWRKELLGIAGHPPPLSLFPVSDRVFLPLPPIGRDAEIIRLSAMDADFVVFGQPGAGKTHLLAHVAKSTEGLFLVSENPEAIMDGIRSQCPKWIIVDDAKARMPMLTLLRQMRADAGIQFRIVAACWPGQQDDVAATLGTTGQEPLEVGQLPQLEIKEIINAAGLVGPDDLLAELIAQANGKPGLAVTLARLSFRETIRDVFTGKALAQDMKRSLTELAGKEAVGLLGYFALAGDAGLKLSVAGELAGGQPDAVRRQAVAMGAAGVLQILDNENLTVEPVRLRQALVAEVFCRPGFSLDWEPLLSTMPSLPDTLVTLICARAVGGKVDDNKLREHIEALAKTGRGVGDVCLYYAQLGRTQCLWVLENYPGLLGKITDYALMFAPREVLPLLFKSCLPGSDGGQTASPLKALDKWTNEVALKLETVKRRELALDALREMEPELRDTPTLLALLAIIFSLRFEWISQPPGERYTMTIQTGPVGLEAVPGIAALWPRALPFLANLSPKLAAELETILRDWVFPGSRLSRKPGVDYIEICKKFGRMMLLDLIQIYSDRWAVLRRFDHMAAESGITLPQGNDPIAAILFPSNASPFDIEDHEEHKDSAMKLAHQWLKEDSISKTVSKWLACEREAREHGIRHGNLSGVISGEIATKATDVRPWFREMWAQHAPMSLLWPFAWQACRQDPTVLDAFVMEARDDSECDGLAMECLLQFSKPGSAIWASSRPFFPAHAGRFGAAVRRNQLEDQTILWLLQNGGSAVAREVAGSLWSADPKGQVPELLQAAWRQAVVADLEEDYQWEEIARLHPDLACAWLKRRMNQTYEERHLADQDYTSNHYLPLIIAALNKNQRRELVDHFAEGNWQSALLASLVGDDLDLLRHALSRPATARLARECLGSPQDHPKGWAERVIVLFENGLSAEDVLEASNPGSIGGFGKFSDHYEKRRLAYAVFAGHADPRVREVCALANAMMQACRDDAVKRERHAAVHGKIF